MKIIVPATSANIGPGFDSVGVAVTKYLQIEVCEERDEWLIEHQIGKWIPHDERNLLLKIALQIVPDLHPRRLKMTSDVPLARGLGSSSSVIVAGIELANQLGKLNLTDHEKLQLATKIEGHPDNVAPAIYGNLVIASSVDGQVSAIVADFPECDFLAYIPNYELRTRDSRGVLPKKLSYKEAVAASSIANVAVAALLAVIVLGCFVYALYTYEPEILTVVTPEVMAITALAVFLFGIIITAICASLSVNKFLKMKAGELYKI